MTIHINTLDYANDLEKAGIVRAHAEAIAQLQARTVRDIVDKELVTKEHLSAELRALRADQAAEIRALRAEFKSDLKIETSSSTDSLRQELRKEIQSSAESIRQDLRKEIDGVNRRIDAMQVQLRSLQFGGAIATFVLAGVVMLSRLIK